MNNPPPQFAQYPRGPRGSGLFSRRGPGVYFDYIGDAFRIAFANPKVYLAGGGIAVGIFLVGYFGSAILMAGLFSLSSTKSNDITAGQIAGVASFYGLIIFLSLAMQIIAYGCAACVVEEAETGQTSLRTMFSGLRNIGMIVAFILCQFLIGIGVLLCFVPGLYLSGLLFFAPTIALVEKVDPIEAIRKSAELTKNYVWMLGLMHIVLVIVASLGSMACSVGLFMTLPVQYVAIGLHYREFRPESTPKMMDFGVSSSQF